MLANIFLIIEVNEFFLAAKCFDTVACVLKSEFNLFMKMSLMIQVMEFAISVLMVALSVIFKA